MSLSTKRSDARTAGVGEPEITDLLRRLSNVLRYGKIHSADYPAARVRVIFGDPADPENHIVTAWIPWLTTRAGGDREWWAPEVGEAALLLSPGGDLSSAVALPAIFSSAAPAPADRPTVHRTVYDDGAVEEYDRAANHKLLDLTACDGTMTIKTGSTEVIVGPGQITLRSDRIDFNDDR